MFSRLIFVCLILPIIVFVFCIESVSACSCGATPAIYESFAQADAVFAGKAISVEEVEESLYRNKSVYNFEVIENFKGATSKTIKIETDYKESSCYHSHKIGESRIIYANRKGELFETDFCGRRPALEIAKAEIQIIRELLNGKSEPQIYGTVLESAKNPLSGESKYVESEKVKVVLVNQKTGKRLKTFTDKFGIFRFSKVSKGLYQIKSGTKQSEFNRNPYKIKVFPNGKACYSNHVDTYCEDKFNSAFIWVFALKK